MNLLENFPPFLYALIPLIIFLALWDVIWKVVGMWYSARNNEPIWFVCIAIFNTMGILPIIYLILSKKKKSENP